MQQATGNQSHFLDGRVIRPHRARRERTGSFSRLHRRKSEQSRARAAGVLVAAPRCPYGVTQTGLSASLSLRFRSAFATIFLVSMKRSGLIEIESMPLSTRNAANSG